MDLSARIRITRSRMIRFILDSIEVGDLFYIYDKVYIKLDGSRDIWSQKERRILDISQI
jgi:hypothetical protein